MVAVDVVEHSPYDAGMQVEDSFVYTLTVWKYIPSPDLPSTLNFLKCVVLCFARCFCDRVA